MRVLGLKPGHDGSVAFVDHGALAFSLEAEKDSYPRFSELGPQTILDALELAPHFPDILAVGGWHQHVPGWHETTPSVYASFRAGYSGLGPGTFRRAKIFGSDIRLFTSSHERSHLLMAAGMYPDAPIEECAILVWEGGIGALYQWRAFGADIKRHHVMSDPGGKFAALFAIADPTFPIHQTYPRLEDAGKLMALAAYGRVIECAPDDRNVITRLLSGVSIYPFKKDQYRSCALYNCGLDTPRFWAAANWASQEIFGAFYDAASDIFEEGELPLLISGGCGLNCDWNERWRGSGLFSDVFVPPCTNDSGSALGTAIDAMTHAGSPCRVDWTVFSGPEFVQDEQPDHDRWASSELDYARLADLLGRGEVVGWVQGRCEIGPRALGHRSLLANPCDASMLTRLNAIKGRESYRPIAPCCRSEDVGRWFEGTNHDPYMLYFAQVRAAGLPAVTHVDGTARLQAVHRHDNARLHQLLGVVEQRSGFSVLCNTSLNFAGRGFINRASDLTRYCDDRSINVFVVNDQMHVRCDVR